MGIACMVPERMMNTISFVEISKTFAKQGAFSMERLSFDRAWKKKWCAFSLKDDTIVTNIYISTRTSPVQLAH